MGHVVQHLIQKRIASFWPNLQNMRVMGCGYAVPYLAPYFDKAERVIAMMPSGQSAHEWPANGKNLVMLSSEYELPLENCSVDRILLIHTLEGTQSLAPFLSEVWRVLKPNGRILVVVPSRTGFWARADWSPFGHGSPFTLSQLCFYLRDNLFVQERTESALFVPPLRLSLMMRSANVLEHMGRNIWPFFGGVHMVEASKQLYASTDKNSGSGLPERVRKFIGGRPVAAPQGFSSNKKKKCEENSQ